MSLDKATTIDFAAHAQTVMRRCNQLALCTQTVGKITRTFCSAAMKEAYQDLQSWMRSAGLQIRMDDACNLIGTTNPNPTAARVLIGSHIDTVPNGGRYDGALGIVLGIAVIEALGAEIRELPFAIDVISFSEEEGVRYRSPYIGSRALAGSFDYSLLDRLDDDKVSMRDAIGSFGLDATQIDTCSLPNDKIIAFIEPHIEQGPVLESEDLAVGVVTGIAGQTRVTARFVGQASHAGTVPMNLRRDALAAAAAWITEVENVATRSAGLLATVGHLIVQPNVPNVIPGEVAVRLDTRHIDDEKRAIGVAELKHVAQRIAAERNLQFFWEHTENQPAVLTNAAISDVLASSVSDLGIETRRLQSGAGHDAVIISQIAPIAMLFLRCKGGISHHPDESIEQADVEVAIRVLVNFIKRLASNTSAAG